jgi:hypothetical protein
MPLDLIEEYRFMVFAVVLGSGKRLFGDGIDKKVLRLAETKTFSSGVVVQTCHPDNKDRITSSLILPNSPGKELSGLFWRATCYL